MIKKFKFSIIGLMVVAFTFLAIFYFPEGILNIKLIPVEIKNQFFIKYYTVLYGYYVLLLALMSVLFGILFLVLMFFRNICKWLLVVFLILHIALFSLQLTSPYLSKEYLDGKVFRYTDVLGENPSPDMKNFSIKRVFYVRFSKGFAYFYEQSSEEYFAKKSHKKNLKFKAKYTVEIKDNEQFIHFGNKVLKVANPEKLYYPNIKPSLLFSSYELMSENKE
ncbi:hypothetical protein QJU43_04460 [Pasteurella atlantica]|uniref:hypothetical protein n=1 Tax=Pasteurellaceae TaxID=712 RepID=UPI002770440A|nr:hypothetical protein [Pasteurella atlantica]MDP8033622.1 hypothetical protein [Pasteurella atlantica]MDP8035598.1 hypothetical protein [Pasteurella atlantica]MDP8037549.1 hypothetical protein [Pasteurella atlantica]MDP8047898.1 hypothetical protein [Pasteurella atlantica]MDP8049853.1 hypothetical protein [Pasteurella atlantica]